MTGADPFRRRAEALDLRPVLAAKRALLRGAARDELLALALEAFRFRLVEKGDGRWRKALDLAAIRLARGEPVLGRLCIEPPGRPGSWWRLDGGGLGDPFEAVLALPVIDWAGPEGPPGQAAACAELLALDPSDPARWWRRTGAVGALNEAEALDLQAPDDRPIRLWRHPLDWVRAGGEASGAACLLWPEARGAGSDAEPGFAARQVLLGPRPIVCEGPEADGFARWIKARQRALRAPLPRVLKRKAGG